MKYLDFDISVKPGIGSTYSIHTRSPVGEADISADLQISASEVETYLTHLDDAIRHAGNAARNSSAGYVQEFGAKLFSFLFNDEINSLYRECQIEAAHQNQGVRLKLHISVPQLTMLPWEFLYDTRKHDYVCLNSHTPLVRYLDLTQRIQPLKIELPLRILGMVANPSDLQRLETHIEKQRMEDAVKEFQKQGLIKLTWVGGETWRDLQHAIRHEHWHIFHFIGHAGFDAIQNEGYVMFSHQEGKSHRISAKQLHHLLSAQSNSLRLALLNACDGSRGGKEDIFSSTAAELVRNGIPAVLAMQYAITDDASIEFAQTFYEAIVDGLPIDTAVTDARNAINLQFQQSLEWGVPTLYMRASDGHIFELSERPADAQFLTQTHPVQIHGLVQGQQNDAPVDSKRPTIAFDWVMIPEGPFTMGSNKEQDMVSDDEFPEHLVDLGKFHVSRTPVTNVQYKQFIDSTRYRAPRHWKDRTIPVGKEEYPVTKISWRDALAFCTWAHVRLPTEAEWEKAARGADGRLYPWGDERPNETRCNFQASHYGSTTSVFAYPNGASPYGVLDLSGNIWEYTSSLYKKYPYDTEDGREDLTASGCRVARGGSYSSDQELVRCACRRLIFPDDCQWNYGFRVIVLD